MQETTRSAFRLRRGPDAMPACLSTQESVLDAAAKASAGVGKKDR